MQCGQNCLLKKKRRDLDVILVVGRKISIHMSQAEREKYSCTWKFRSRLGPRFDLHILAPCGWSHIFALP